MTGAEGGGSGRRADRARQVADALRRQVLDGAWPSGMLPDERELTAAFGASRNCVREALRLLAGEGLVERRRGVGTVVVSGGFEHPLGGLAGLAEVVAGRGPVVNEVREMRPVRPEAGIARRLGLPEGGRAVYLERLRRVAGEPVSLDRTYLAPEVGDPLAALDRRELENRDVFALIEAAAGQKLGRAEMTVRCAVADPATAAELGMSGGPAAVFVVERLARLADGRPVDLEFLRIRGDRVTLRAEPERGAV